MTSKAEVKYFLSLNSSFARLGTEAIHFSVWYNGSQARMALLYRKPSGITFLAHTGEKLNTGTIVLLDLREEKKAN